MMRAAPSWIATVLVVFGLPTSAAHARGGDQRLERSDWLVAPDVRAVASRELARGTVRAVVIVREGQARLLVETLAPEGALHARREVLQFQHGLGTFPLLGTARTVDALDAQPDALRFRLDVGSGQEPLRCVLSWNSDSLPRCEGVMPATVPAWPGVSAPTDGRPDAADEACETSFYGRSSQTHCKSVARRTQHDVTPVVVACARHAFGDEGATRCLDVAAAMRFDAPSIIGACDTATYGQESFLACLDEASAFAVDPSGAIVACDHTMSGDQATVACVRLARRYPFDATTAIVSCERATPTDEAALVCIRRGGAF